MTTAKKPKTASKKPARASAPKRPVAKTAKLVSPNRGKTVDWYLSTLSASQRAHAQKIVDLIDSTTPSAKATIKWSQPVWELEGPFAWLKGSKSHLSFGFWRGAELADRAGLLEGTGDRMRHVKLRDGQELPARELAAFIREAADLNRKNGDPTAGRRKTRA
jgi:hypothetical protein